MQIIALFVVAAAFNVFFFVFGYQVGKDQRARNVLGEVARVVRNRQSGRVIKKGDADRQTAKATGNFIQRLWRNPLAKPGKDVDEEKVKEAFDIPSAPGGNIDPTHYV